MDTIKIDHEGTRIVLSFRREVGDIRKVRCLSADQALGLGLLMTADAPEEAIINFDVTAELSLQVINAPYQIVYLSVRDLRRDRTLVVCIEGKAIRQVGRQLLLLGQGANTGGPSFIRQVSHCYLEDAKEG